jgi:hypothetical protein
METESEIPKVQYRWHGLPITPAAIQELTLELFAGRTVERQEIVAAVERAHAERGGSPARAADFARSVKKALSTLKEEGKVVNPTHGFWRILHLDGQVPDVPLTEPVTTVEDDLAPPAELILGEGESSVYLYYYPTYRREAESKGSEAWPCKIGMSERDPVARILSQASTAMPESPRIGLLLRTSLPSQWEAVIHSVLSLRDKALEEAPGSEWFATSPREVAEIITWIAPCTKHTEPRDRAESR